MKKTQILITFFLLTACSSLFGQWVEQVNPSGKKLHSVNFINSSIGYACGDTGTVMFSVNAGVTWVNNNSGIPSNINMTSIQFLDPANGFCSGGLGSISGKIYKTTNNGGSWALVFDTTNAGIRDIFFINNNTGWAAGNTVVKYTSNGGVNWMTRTFNATSNTSVVALSADTVFVTGFGSGGYIAKSVNGGVNWSFTTVPGNLADIRFAHFPNSFTGYAGGLALGGQGGMCKTTDRGQTWVQLNSYSGTTPTDCFFIDANTGYVVNSTQLQLTTDGGSSWSNQTIPANGQFEKISLVPPFGCIVGKKIAVIGTIGIQQISNEIPKDFSLGQNYPNPFNPTTNIEFSLPKNAEVKIVIHNILGKQIAVPVEQQLGAGTYNLDFSGSGLSSGIYFYSLIVDGITINTKKMNLIK